MLKANPIHTLLLALKNKNENVNEIEWGIKYKRWPRWAPPISAKGESVLSHTRPPPHRPVFRGLFSFFSFTLDLFIFFLVLTLFLFFVFCCFVLSGDFYHFNLSFHISYKLPLTRKQAYFYQNNQNNHTCQNNHTNREQSGLRTKPPAYPTEAPRLSN